MRYIRLLVFVGLGWAVIACSGDHNAATTPTPSPTATSASTSSRPSPAATASSLAATPRATPAATPLPVLGPPLPAGPQVVWEPAELPVFTGIEHPTPFDWVTTDEPVWRLYEVGPKGGPRLVYETPRQVYGLALTPDDSGFRMIVASTPDGPREGLFLLFGLIDIGRNGVETVVAPLVQSRTYEVSPVSSDGRRPFVQFHAYRDEGPIYLARPSGEIVRLNGLGDKTTFAGWTPDGESLVVQLTQENDGLESRSQADSGLYLVPLRDDVAVQMLTNVASWGDWSPDGSKLPILARGGQIFIFDRETNRATQLTTDKSYRTDSSLKWSPDGAFLAVDADVLDAATGRRVIRLITPGNEVGALFTRDGRYFLASEEPWSGGGSGPRDELCPRDAGLRNRTHIYDLQTGQSRILLDCDRGFFLGGSELSPQDGTHKLLLTTTGCWGCDSGSSAISVLTLETAEVKRLTPLARANGYVVSPDGSRFALTGPTPKILAADGETVVEEIEIPPNTLVSRVLWAPDGVTYYYLLGPRIMVL